MQTLIIIPTYNEKGNLDKLIRQILRILPQTDILIVDDNSPDGSGDFAQKLSQRNRKVHLIRRPKKQGLGSAYILGFKFALKKGYDFVFEMDADLSHSPAYLLDFLKQAFRYDLILGSRYIPQGAVKNWSPWRRYLSLWANRYARFVLNIPYHDLTGGFKCYSRKALKSLKLEKIISEGYVFQIETTYRIYRKGLSIKEIPIIFRGRFKGNSKISRKVCFEALWKIPLMRLMRV